HKYRSHRVRHPCKGPQPQLHTRGRSTRCISSRALMGSAKFLNAAEQYTESKHPSGKDIADASPRQKSIFTPTLRALSVAIRTSVRLMSRPMTLYFRSFTNSMTKNPGPGATSNQVA